jgi:hypothetical protein
MPPFRRSLIIISAVCWFPIASAYAQQELALADRERTPRSESEHEPGKYTGVSLGGEGVPPGAYKPGQSVAVTWPGFQMRPDGGSCVFLQTTAPLRVETSKGEHKLIIDLGEVRVAGTNRLPLDTHYFNTPVTRVELKRGLKHTTLELVLRADVEPRIASAKAKSGFHFLSIDFGAGQYLPPPAATAKKNVAPAPPSKLDGTAQMADRADTEVDLGAVMNSDLPPSVDAHKPVRGKITMSKRTRAPLDD